MMKLLSHLKTSKPAYKILYTILFCNLLYTIFFRYNFKMPYGFDEIITIFPIGQELRFSNINQWNKLLFYNFLSEDHLSPVTNIFAYLISFIKGDIADNLFWACRFSYLLIFIVSILLMYEVNKTKSSIIIFIILFLNSGPINFSILSYNMNFNLVCVFGLFTILYCLKYQKNHSILNLFLFLFFKVIFVKVLHNINYSQFKIYSHVM